MPGTSLKSRPRRKPAVPTVPAASIPSDESGDRWFVLENIAWEGYIAISDAVERPNLRVIYCDGRLTFVTESRKHGWSAECLGYLVVALAQGLGMNWEAAASATFRKEEKRGGVEGDKTFYFGEHARRMKGPKDIDLNIQPPPDLAIEVEVSHSADDAMIVWGRLRVPEVWRFDPIAMECSFWGRRRNGTYARRDTSEAFPMLTPTDVVEQIRQASELGMAAWHARLGRWVKKVMAPRIRGGG